MSDTEAKTKPASPRKLRKLRQEGTVANSTESAGFAAAAAGIVVLLALTGVALTSLFELFEVVATAMTLPFDEVVRATSADVLWRLVMVVGPIAGASVFVAIIVAILYNGGILFSTKPVAPQLERISPVSGLKRIYGRRGWVETATTFLRIFLWLAFVAILAWIWLPRFAGAVQCGFPCQARTAVPALWLLGIGLIVVFVLSAGADMLIQKSLFLFEQMMTETEAKQERKEAFGDPGIRAERRRRQREEPPDPSAVGAERANICFFAGNKAVAIRYHPQQARVPRVSARLTGDAAKALRDRLTSAGLPVVESAQLVKGCWSVEPGGAMPTDLYEPFSKTLRAAMS